MGRGREGGAIHLPVKVQWAGLVRLICAALMCVCVHDTSEDKRAREWTVVCAHSITGPPPTAPCPPPPPTHPHLRWEGVGKGGTDGATVGGVSTTRRCRGRHC